MKAVILAGGKGTRFREETESRPKPMVEIGGYPILWHIMKIYAAHGVTDFIVCLGYKGYVIKEYFANYFLHMSDVTINLKTNSLAVHRSSAEPWQITLVDTGDETMTGGRLKKIKPYLDDGPFCMTYGDGVSDVNIQESIRVFEQGQALAQVTAVRAPGRFGVLDLDPRSRVRAFQEKVSDGWINGGFFVLSPRVLEYIHDDMTMWEQEPLEALAADGQLHAYRHDGFWHCMDMLRDKEALEKHWSSGRAPWKVWQDE
ncbi:glucose-1-phosphate cytidylyltransferase [Pararhodospirillum oryzae]|uniref:Glucose-1-phosphate cytidylyltransferase n=1 Tax=Pararhodospirillum oryzae TaxID=478448 RepID=A0A512H7U9_9PROT|nr:glucose-1-phosphate cytidylyltransferase [Pararhodospirillum oryzae]GEO81533.1 glucose-1-phosphate cytidylyltransferase [Pararhodospirillum oryzae]